MATTTPARVWRMGSCGACLWLQLVCEAPRLCWQGSASAGRAVARGPRLTLLTPWAPWLPRCVSILRRSATPTAWLAGCLAPTVFTCALAVVRVPACQEGHGSGLGCRNCLWPADVCYGRLPSHLACLDSRQLAFPLPDLPVGGYGRGWPPSTIAWCWAPATY